MDGNNNSFHLTPLTEEDVDKLGLSHADLWLVQSPSGQSFGPFSTEMLKKDSKERPSFYEECQVYNLVTEEWKVFYTLTEFQRRKPKLVPAQSLIKSEAFFLLVNGQKTGPYGYEELKSMIVAKQVSLNQEISVDEGKSWIKIYEHHAFDRRVRAGQEELPFQPEKDLFKKTEEKLATSIFTLQKDKEESRLISGLAFLGRGNDKGQKVSAQEQAVDGEKHGEQPSSKTGFKIKFAAFALLACIIAGGIALNGTKSSAPELGETSQPSDSKRIDNSERAPRKRQPASTGSSLKIKRSQTKTQPTRARRYEPSRAERTPSSVAPRAQRQPRRVPENRQVKRITHTYEDFEAIDIDDPKVREELTRELAGDYYDDQGDGFDQTDSQGNYPQDEYQEEPQANDYGEDYQNPAAEQEPAPTDYPADEAPYEEYGDFE